MPVKTSKSKVTAKASNKKTPPEVVPTAAASTSAPQTKDVLIHNRVSVAQIEKACAALAAHRAKTGDGVTATEDQEAGLRSNPADTVWLQVTVKALSATAPPKAVRIPVPHAIYPENASVCLLTTDPQRAYKDLMVADKITQVQRVVGVTKLKGKFAPFEARRQLMNDHDVFLADDRIIPMLPKLLGKKWMQDRKSPIPVQLTKTKDGRVRKQVEGALSATYFHRNKGTCSSIRIGTLRGMTPAQMAENVAAVLPDVVGKHIKGNWDNVQSLDIKTGTSAALPVWNVKMSERWTGLPEPKSQPPLFADESEEEGVVAVKAPAPKKVKTGAAEKTGKSAKPAKVRSSTSEAITRPAKAKPSVAKKQKA